MISYSVSLISVSVISTKGESEVFWNKRKQDTGVVVITALLSQACGSIYTRLKQYELTTLV